MLRLYTAAGILGVSLLLGSFLLSLNKVPASEWTIESLRIPISEWLLAAGVGLLTVIVTSLLVERQSDKRMAASRLALEQLHHALMTDLKTTSEGVVTESCNSVGKFVFGSNYSQRIIDATLGTIFSSALTRKNYKYLVCFRPGPTKVSVLITETYSYLISNDSILDQVFRPKVSFEDASALYGSWVGYKPDRLVAVRVGQREFTADEIEYLNSNARNEGTKFDLGGKYWDLGEYRVPSGNQMLVSITIEAVEAMVGQWVSTTSSPIDGLEVEVMNLVESLLVYVLPVGDFDFQASQYPVQDLPTQWSRMYDGVLLTNSGWNIRWGCPELDFVRR